MGDSKRKKELGLLSTNLNLGTLFKESNDKLYLDMVQIEKMTDSEFVRILSERVRVPSADLSVKEMKFHDGKRGVKFLYFQIGNTWYSFGWDKRAKSLIASIMDGSKGWHFIVGYQGIVDK